MTPLPVHSPLGASAAERWMACPGSVALIQMLGIKKESDEPEWTKEGTRAHELAAHCLTSHIDAWEFEKDMPVEMADAIQLYLDTVRPLAVPSAQVFVEQRISNPDNELFYGTVDYATIADSLMTVNDFKYGKGVVIEADHNPQMMYYAYGLLMQFPDVRRIVMRIIQPRAFHSEGPVRRWEVTAEELAQWGTEVLEPAMTRTATDKTLDVGEHCRFCPAKIVCPMLQAAYHGAVNANPAAMISASDDALAQEYKMLAGVKKYIKAIEEEVLRRLISGHMETQTIVKLVNKKANRVWKPEALELFKSRFPTDWFTPQEMKSPAQMEALGEAAKHLVHEYAYTPQSGLTVTLVSDKRPGIKAQSITEAFKSAVLDGEIA